MLMKDVTAEVEEVDEIRGVRLDDEKSVSDI
jgi:hypothetical protein